MVETGGLGDSAAGDADAPKSTEDLTIFVQNLLQQMQGRFNTMSDTIVGRIDEMGARIDELENSIGELMAQAGIDEEPLPEGAAPPQPVPAAPQQP